MLGLIPSLFIVSSFHIYSDNYSGLMLKLLYVLLVILALILPAVFSIFMVTATSSGAGYGDDAQFDDRVGVGIYEW